MFFVTDLMTSLGLEGRDIYHPAILAHIQMLCSNSEQKFLTELNMVIFFSLVSPRSRLHLLCTFPKERSSKLVSARLDN